MPQYRDLYQSANKKKKPISKKMQQLIDREKRSYEECECCHNGLVTSTAHEAIDADYEPTFCMCPCHIPICKYCEQEGVGEWDDSPICQDCFEGFTGNKFPEELYYYIGLD
jgi:hypothetical protein